MNISLHRRVLLSLLQKLYKQADLAPLLGFKGGTSLYFLHGLPRFSVDLDFNLIANNAAFPAETMQQILESELTLHDAHEKEHTWFWNGVYEPGQWNVKVEVSKRLFQDAYNHESLFGLALPVLSLEHQLSHKLCAITDRNIMVNRDLFDTHFLLKKHISIAEDIIRQRTGKGLKGYLDDLIEYIPQHMSKRGILDGLGELLNPETKQWTQDSLLEERLFLLRAAKQE